MALHCSTRKLQPLRAAPQARDLMLFRAFESYPANRSRSVNSKAETSGDELREVQNHRVRVRDLVLCTP
eukprot:1867956-Pyramimonas_sp.AAC.1